MTMHARTALAFAGIAAAVGIAMPAHADSFVSSASSAGSESSGSVSDSFKGSSNSSRDSSKKDDKKAQLDYRIVEVASVPDHPDTARLTLQGEDPEQRMVLDLPQAVVVKRALTLGDGIRVRDREYGYEFARTDTREAFFLVLADDWYSELKPRALGL
ncbi:hypothetical protein BH10PSE17_BH10PSE17_09820 [soil metagenome]